MFQSTKKSYSIADLLRTFRVKKKDRRPFLKLLDSLVSKGTLEVGKSSRFSLPSVVKRERGLFAIDRRGEGLVRLFSGGRVTVPIGFFSTALPGDEVEVGLWDSGKSFRHRGGVLLVHSRLNSLIPGKLSGGGRQQITFLPFNNPSYPNFPIESRIDLSTLSRNEYCWATPALFDSYGQITVFSHSVDPPVNCDPEVAYIAARSGAPVVFPSAVQREIVGLSADCPDELPRRDLTELPFITIDGDDAKDFDDAITVAKIGENFRLWVAIADVASYVQRGSALDNEAYSRGNSIYPADGVIPMLPPLLSENICSLRPDEQKRVLVAEMEFNGKGVLQESSIYAADIVSRRRMTYREVEGFIDGDSSRFILNSESLDVESSLQFSSMAKLTAILREKRMNEGSLDLNLPESYVELGKFEPNGAPKVVVIKNRARYFAHSIVEEFMLAANRTVAVFLGKRVASALFRIHGGPSFQKWNEFTRLLRFFGFDPLDDIPESAGELAELLESCKDHPSIDIIQANLLRCLQQAQYSEKDSGHFALSFDDYCHFTSPIRRYPDLIVHRVVREIIAGHSGQYSLAELKKMASHTSMTERRAMDIERERLQEWKCRYLKNRVGEQFEAVISSVKPFGFFVNITDISIEGLVSVSRMEDDYYKFNQDTYALEGVDIGRIYQLGAKVMVILSSINEQTLDIDFSLPSQHTGRSRSLNFKSKRMRRRK